MSIVKNRTIGLETCTIEDLETLGLAGFVGLAGFAFGKD